MNIETMTLPALKALDAAIKDELKRRLDIVLADARELNGMIGPAGVLIVGGGGGGGSSRLVAKGRGHGKRVGLEAYQECAARGMTKSETARHLGVSPVSVFCAAKKHGLDFARSKHGPRG
jgi:hypothetical protein